MLIYNKTATQYCIDTSEIDHQLTVIVNLNADGDVAREEVKQYLESYLIETYPNVDIAEKMNTIIKENAVGTDGDYYESTKLAIEKTGASTVLLSFESMRDQHNIEDVINMVNQKIHQNLT